MAQKVGLPRLTPKAVLGCTAQLLQMSTVSLVGCHSVTGVIGGLALIAVIVGRPTLPPLFFAFGVIVLLFWFDDLRDRRTYLHRARKSVSK